jgi:transcriptional regulator with XRE-family HTH domain
MKGNPLREFREQHGMSQVELARKIGVSSVTVSRWETGQRRIDPKFLPKIAEQTGINKKQLRSDLEALLN